MENQDDSIEARMQKLENSFLTLEHAHSALAGQVSAMRAALLILIATHQDRERLALGLEKIFERSTANALPTEASDAALDALRELQATLLSLARGRRTP